MSHEFSRVPTAEIQRSSFDRSHAHKSTIDAGYLYPLLVDEALPGDTFNLNATYFARLNTPIRPVLDNMYLDTFYFAVPLRLVWDNFEKMMGAQDDPGDSTDFTVPMFANSSGVTEGELHDYMGIPPDVPDLEFSALYARSYNLIWRDWFRDQNLQDSPLIDRDDNPGSQSLYTLLRRGKRHDYFTSALPFPQKGDAVSISLGSTAPVDLDGIVGAGGPPTFDVGGSAAKELSGGSSTTSDARWDSSVSGAASSAVWNDPQLEGTGVADLSSASTVTINALRQSFQIQKMLERDARGGTRMVEINLAHFKVQTPDFRLQRPEYLGGGSTPIKFQPVEANNSNSFDGLDIGDLAAYAMGVAQSGFTKSFTEHCIIIGLVNVRADLTYQQGLERQFSRETRFDFYFPALAHLGEQAVLNKEIYAQGSNDPGVDEETWGYQERFAEYRYKPSRISGKMRSGATGTLDVWHLSQEFGSLPVLGDTFIQDDPPIDRIVATPEEPDFKIDCWYSMRCARPMPVFSVPGLIDHF